MKSRYIILIVAALIPLLCGLENEISEDDLKIVGGQFAQISSFPSQVAIRDKEYGHRCGGVLLTYRWVVSAAHCFYNTETPISRYLVRAGSSYSYEGGAISAVTKIIIHTDFNPNIFDYDIAMVKLTYGFPQSVRNKFPIAFAKLAKQEPSKWSYVWATGWGALYYRGEAATRLHAVRLKIVPRDYCNKETEMAGLITQRMICAGILIGGKGPCQGDSGGPLYQGDTIVGITSWGIRCAQRNSPSAWTNVAALRGWILETQRTG